MDQNDDVIEGNDKAADDIFAAIGAADLPDEDKGILLAKMLKVIQTRTLIKILDALPEEKDGELDKLVSGGDPDALEAFLNENVPNYSRFFEDEAKKLRQELEIEFNQKK